MVAAFLTMLVGILGALAQADIKRLLSFTLVSHIGYMIFGIALGTPARHGRHDLLRRAPHHGADHACSWSPGLIERVGGTTSLSRLGGMLKAAPFVAILFFIGAMNLGGIPPFSGFLGKVALFQAGVAGRRLAQLRAHRRPARPPACSPSTPWPGPGTWRSGGRAPKPRATLLARARCEEDPHDEGTVLTKTVSPLMTGATTAMLALTVALTVFAGPLFDLASRAAVDIEHPATYIDAVFPDGAP